MPDETKYQFRQLTNRSGYPSYAVFLDGQRIGEVWKIPQGFWRGKTEHGDSVIGAPRSRRAACDGLISAMVARQGGFEIHGWTRREII